MRKHYLDNLRSFAVVAVVVYHVFYLFNGIATAGVVGPFAPVQYQDAVQYVLYPWLMVLLFLISGMSARFELARRSDREFFRAKTLKCLVPSTIGLFVFQWLQGYVNMQLSGAFEDLSAVPAAALYPIMALSGTGVLWYLHMLWIFSLLLILFRRLCKGKVAALFEKLPAHPLILALLGVFVWGSAQILNTPVVLVYRFGIYGFVFLLGYCYFSRDAVIDCVAKFRLLWGIVAVALGVAYAVLYFGQNYAEAPAVNAPLAVAYLWFACLALLGLFKRHCDAETPLGSFLHREGWGLYIFHYLPLSACGLLLRGSALPPLCHYLLCALAAFVGAYLLYALLSRIPFLRWCILGLKKPQKASPTHADLE